MSVFVRFQVFGMRGREVGLLGIFAENALPIFLPRIGEVKEWEPQESRSCLWL